MSPAAQISWGHAALAACFCCYLAWWVVFFRPAGARPEGAVRALGVTAIAAAFVLGVAGVWLEAAGIGGLPRGEGLPAPWQIAMGGLLAYVVLFVVTTVPLDRPPTSELFIMVAWAALSACALCALFGAGLLGRGAFAALLVALAAVLAESLVCYMRFYRLEGMASFVDGAIPLTCGIALEAVFAAVAAVAAGEAG